MICKAEIILLGTAYNAERKVAKSGNDYMTLNIRTTEKVKDEWIQAYHKVFIFGNQVDYFDNKITNGMPVYCVARVSQSKDDDNKIQYTFTVKEMIILEGKKEETPVPAKSKKEAPKKTISKPVFDDDEDEEVPF